MKSIHHAMDVNEFKIEEDNKDECVKWYESFNQENYIHLNVLNDFLLEKTCRHCILEGYIWTC